MKTTISEDAREYLAVVEFDISAAIQHAMKYVPGAEAMGISEVVILKNQSRKHGRQSGTQGSYSHAHDNRPAYIELYAATLFPANGNPTLAKFLKPVMSFGVAHILFHEIGHHVHNTKRHGIKRASGERFAEKYADKLAGAYALDNASAIESCFDEIEKLGRNLDAPVETIERMRTGWRRQFARAQQTFAKEQT